MLVEGLLMLNTYDHVGPTTSYEQARAFVDELLSQPYEAELAAIFKERRPSWARVVERPGRGR